MSLNRAQLIGHVGKDPEIRATQSGNKVANFSLATSERWTDKQTGELREKVQWHRIIVWNEKLIEIVEKYVKKGSQLYVEGAIETREYEGSDGTKRWTTEIVLQGFNGAIRLLDKLPSNRPPAAEGPDQGRVVDRPGSGAQNGQGGGQDVRGDYQRPLGGSTGSNGSGGHMAARNGHTQAPYDDEIPF